MSHCISRCFLLQVTQLGHVKDLATAFQKVLGNDKAKNQIYNISGERFVTFDGLARACARAAGAPEPELVHFDAKKVDLGKAKAFPLRDQHFFTSIEKVRMAQVPHQKPLSTCHLVTTVPGGEQAMDELDWRPEFGLQEGLKDSYEKDFGRGTFRKEADFSADDKVLASVK